MELLDDAAIARGLAELPGWERRGNEIVKTYQRRDFADAMGLVNRVADVAEEAQHHPDIDIRWNKVTLALSTHSAGGLTGNDIELAKRIEALAV